MQHSEREARALAAAMLSVARIQAERGEDEEGTPPDPQLVAACLTEAREAEGLPPVELPEGAPGATPSASATPRGSSSSSYDSAEEEEGEGGSGAAAAAAAAAGSARSSPRARKEAAARAAAAAATPPPAPRKRFTAVLFADSNTHVLLTGDASGRVDVYRVQGVAFPGEELDTSAKVEALQGALRTLV